MRYVFSNEPCPLFSRIGIKQVYIAGEGISPVGMIITLRGGVRSVMDMLKKGKVTEDQFTQLINELENKGLCSDMHEIVRLIQTAASTLPAGFTSKWQFMLSKYDEYPHTHGAVINESADTAIEGSDTLCKALDECDDLVQAGEMTADEAIYVWNMAIEAGIDLDTDEEDKESEEDDVPTNSSSGN